MATALDYVTQASAHRFKKMTNNPHHLPFKATETAYLYGGPLDGLQVQVGLHTHGWADQNTGSLYTYCPHATALFERNTFLSSDLSYDALAH
jgi:hypothetical protein